MKKTAFFLLTVFGFITAACSQGRTYYIANEGSDSNNGTSSSTPWKSIDKLNATSFGPGDNVLFKSGENFHGSIQIKQSGAANAPITVSSYGDGAKPVITGFITLSDWRDIGNGIWEVNVPGVATVINMVTINSKLYAMGRTPNANSPNKGYATFQSHSGNNTIYDPNLSDRINWTGAEAVVRKTNFLWDRGIIQSQSNGNIVYVSADQIHSFYDGSGYFIQNDPRTLDEKGEWYFNPRSKTLQMFFGNTGPQNVVVQVSNVENLIALTGNNYVTFNNIALSGANGTSVLIDKSSNITFSNSSISFSGKCGIYIKDRSANLRITNNTIDQTQDTGIDGFNCPDVYIAHNKVTNTGLFAGMGNQYVGIFMTGENAIVESNSIENTGYNGLQLYGNNALAKNNFINNFTLVLDDGGGIFESGPQYTGRKIIGNIVMNGHGAVTGAKLITDTLSEGIYVDDNTSDIQVINNTVAHMSGSGIKVHNAHNITVENNTLFDNHNQIFLDHDNNPNGRPIRDLKVDNNLMFIKKASQNTLRQESIQDDIDQFGERDKNIYAQPFNSEKDWQHSPGSDANSKRLKLMIPYFKVNRMRNNSLFQNSRFDFNLNGASSFSAKNNFKIYWVPNGKLDGGEIQANVNDMSGNENLGNNIITANIGSVNANVSYVLRFSLIGADNGGSLTVFLRKSGAPYNPVSDQQVVNITGTRVDHQFVLTTNQSEGNVLATFVVKAPNNTTFWLDNLSVTPADLTFTNPDTYTKFVYNETDNVKTIALGDNYKAVNGAEVGSQVTLQPHSSLILIKSSTPFEMSPVAQ